MKNVIIIIFTIGTLLLAVACSTQPPENLKEPTTKLIAETPPDVSIIINEKSYDTLLGSYCWEKANEKTSEATVECVDKAAPEVLLADETPINVQTNADGELDIDFSTPPTDMEVTAFSDGEAVDVDVSDQTISFPSEQGSYYYVAWLTWEEDDDVLNETSYAFAVEVQ